MANIFNLKARDGFERQAIPYSLSLEHDYCNDRTYVEFNTYTLIHRLLRDGIQRTRGMDTEVEVILKSTGYNNLLAQFTYHLIDGGDKAYIYFREDGTIELNRSVPSHLTETEYEVIQVGMGGLAELLRYKFKDIYLLDNNRSFLIHSSSNMLFKVSGLRYKPDNAESSVRYDAELHKNMVSQIEQLSKGISKGGNVLTLDANDTLENIPLDTEPYDTAIGQLREDIAGLLGVPMSYVFGKTYGGLATTGEGDKEQYYQAVERMFETYTMRLIFHLYELLGKKGGLATKITLFRNMNDDIDGLFNNLLTLEAVSLIDDDQKKQITAQILNRYGLSLEDAKTLKAGKKVK